MNVLPMRIPIRRALRVDEMAAILARISAVQDRDLSRLLDVAVAVVYDALLADLGLSLGGLPEGLQIDPRLFLIPTRQRDEIRTAIISRAASAGSQPTLAIRVTDLLPSADDDLSAPAAAAVVAVNPQAGELQVSLTREAVWVVTAAWQHIEELARQYGRHSEEHVEAAASWLSGLNQIINEASGPRVRVDRDGVLSLLAHTGVDNTVRVIFYGDSRRCVAGDDCAAVTTSNGTAHAPNAATAVVEHEHRPSFPVDGPRPGSWDVRS